MGFANPEERLAEALRALESCRLCPRACGVDRLAGETGFCGAGAEATVAAVSVHHGEEPPISGTRGSGTVFFSHCNMRCLFCQNYPISQLGVGETMTAGELAARILRLQKRGVHNVNFITPTPHIPRLVEAVLFAREKGLAIPVVYNTNGYESLEGLSLLDGIVDIYLPDMKYRSDDLAEIASGTPDYAAHNDRAVAGMIRRAGPLAIGDDGTATRGVLIRHLVLPGRVDETIRVLSRIRSAFGPGIPLSLMGQYFPAYRAASPGRNRMKSGSPGGEAPAARFERKLTEREYDRAIDAAIRLGLENVFVQDDPQKTAVTR